MDRVIQKWHPLGIWLFGSRARGDAGPASDWDLLIVVPNDVQEVDDPLAGWQIQKAARVRSDLILCRSADFQEDQNTPNTLVYEASHAGVLIYER